MLLESLEDRRLLAGDTLTLDAAGQSVTIGPSSAEIAGEVFSFQDFDSVEVLGAGTILVAGDSNDNHLVVSQGTTPGTAQMTLDGGPAIKVDSSVLTFDAGDGNDKLTIDESASSSDTYFSIRVGRITGPGGVRVSHQSTETIEVLSGLADDSIAVNRTADAMTILINTSDGADHVVIRDTGVGSQIQAQTGSGNDRLTIQSTAVGSVVEAHLGDGDDLAALRSVNRQLGQIQGTVKIVGEGNDASTRNQKVTVDGKVVSATVQQGDSIILDDSENPSDGTYSVSDVRIASPDGLDVSFQSFENVRLATGSGSDQVTVHRTVAQDVFSLETGGGSDLLTVLSTGAGSLMRADMGDDADHIIIAKTGDGSVTRLTTKSGDDRVTILNSGLGSGVQTNTGSDNDIVTIHAVGVDSATRIDTEDGSDRLSILTTAVGSVVDSRLGD